VGKIEKLRDEDPGLRPIGVDALLAREDEIEADLPGRRGENRGYGQRILERDAISANPDAFVGAQREAVLDRVFDAVGTEARDRDFPGAEALADAKRLLDRELVIGIRNPLDAGRVDLTVPDLDPGLGVGHLFHEYEDVHVDRTLWFPDAASRAV